MVCIPPGPSDVENPSLGVTVTCQGSLVDVERAVISIIGGDRELVWATYPHASKSENMKANKSFMVSNSYFTVSAHFSLY